MAATITNANIDTAAAAVAAPYGPLVRVTDVTTYPEPNSEIRLHLTSDLGEDVYMTYEQLTSAEQNLPILERAHPITAKVARLITKITALDAAADAMSAPHTEADYDALLALFRDIPEISGLD